jgi:hypothetical protein
MSLSATDAYRKSRLSASEASLQWIKEIDHLINSSCLKARVDIDPIKIHEIHVEQVKDYYERLGYKVRVVPSSGVRVKFLLSWKPEESSCRVSTEEKIIFPNETEPPVCPENQERS